MDIENEILELIAIKNEGGYWDFKQEHYTNRANMLHDIICMSNNLMNKDAFIILGVEDKTGNIVGVENDSNNRINQEAIIQFLKDKRFAGGMRPQVELTTLHIDRHEIDVIIVKNSYSTPYFLINKYECEKKTVRACNIYTRIVDVNTDIDKTADIDKVEYLWRKRFGIDLPPLDKAKILLENPKDWLPMGTDGIHSTHNEEYNGIWYNKQNPEFTIKYQKEGRRFQEGRIDALDQDLYWMKRLPWSLHNAFVYTIELKYHSTSLFHALAVAADGYRFERTFWKAKQLFQNQSSTSILYCYVEKNSLEFLIDEWLNNKQETVKETLERDIFSSLEPWKLQSEYGDSCNPYSVVPVFENAKEHEDFIAYVISRKVEFLTEIGDFRLAMQAANPEYIEYLCKTGEVLVNWLGNWRSSN